MKLLASIVVAICIFFNLQAQEIVRGSWTLRIEEVRSESLLRLTLSDASGDVLYQIGRELGYDTPRPAVHLYANGTLLLVDGFAGVREYYNRAGVMESRISFKGTIAPDHERIFLVSGNDSLAAVLVSESGESESRILVMDWGGMTRVDRTMPGSFASGLLFSPGGETIAAGTYDWKGSALGFRTEFVRHDGTELFSSNKEFRGGSWAPDGALFVVYGRNEAILFDIGNREAVSAVELGENRVVHDLLWDNGIPFIAASPAPTFESGKWTYPSLTVMNLVDGRVVFRSKGPAFTNVKLEKSPTGVSARIDGQSVLIK